MPLLLASQAMHQAQAADSFGEPRSRPARDRLEAYPTLRRGLVVRLIAPIHARSLCDFALRRLELVDACKNKRYMIKFLDESSGGQD
jgi:hypothetical protein